MDKKVTENVNIKRLRDQVMPSSDGRDLDVESQLPKS